MLYCSYQHWLQTHALTDVLVTGMPEEVLTELAVLSVHVGHPLCHT